MKIAHVTGSLSRQSGGVFPILQRLSAELVYLGCNVEAFGTYDSDYDKDRESWKRVRTHAFATRGPARLAYAPKFRPALEHFEPDVCHLHGVWMMMSALCHQWHVQTGRPYVISAQGMLNRWAIHHQAWKKRIAAFLYEKKNLRGASCLHALSEQEIEDYRDYGLSNPVALIPNGVDIPDEPDQSVSAPWSNVVPAGSKVLFFMGRIHQKKGLIELLKGWSCAGPLRKEWRLVIAGWDDGGYELLVRKQIEESGLTREVFLIGSQFGEAKEAALFKADAFILPSHSEGLPIALLEAWAHRLPVLMTPQCNLPIGFTCGAAIPILPNPESIAEGLEKLFMMSNAERVGMGCKGRELIEARFTWKIVAGEMRTVYEWLAGMGPKPGCIVDGK